MAFDLFPLLSYPADADDDDVRRTSQMKYCPFVQEALPLMLD